MGSYFLGHDSLLKRRPVTINNDGYLTVNQTQFHTREDKDLLASHAWLKGEVPSDSCLERIMTDEEFDDTTFIYIHATVELYD